MINPFAVAGILAAATAVLFLVRWFVAVAGLRRDARFEYSARKGDRPQTITGVDEDLFVKIYVDGHAPRWTLYAAATLISAILITPFALYGLFAFWDWIIVVLDAGEWFAPGYYPWMFYLFFGLIGAWALCGYVAARFHHRRAPEAFQAALMRARGEPLDDVVIRRGRPKWARRASVIAAQKDTSED